MIEEQALPSTEERIESLLDAMTLEEQVALLAGADFWTTVPIERLGIPAIKVSDGPNGARGGGSLVGGVKAASFPVGIALAASWNPALVGRPQTLEDLKFANYFKEIFLDSDTQVALISGSGSEDPRDWFLTNEMKAQARKEVNDKAGARRMFSHAIFMPGLPGWLDRVDEDLEELQPDSFKGYTVGDNTNKHLARHPWHLDDEKLLCPFHEKRVRAARTRPSLANVCVHKGLFPQAVAEPHLCAAMLGQLIKGLGADHVVWGTDAVWTGAPPWLVPSMT